MNKFRVTIQKSGVPTRQVIIEAWSGKEAKELAEMRYGGKALYPTCVR